MTGLVLAGLRLCGLAAPLAVATTAAWLATGTDPLDTFLWAARALAAIGGRL